MKRYIKETIKYLLRSKLFIYKYIAEIDKLYSMTPSELKLRNEKVFLKIFKNAYIKSPFYHKLYTDAGIKIEDINGLCDIEKLPIITKDMIKKHFKEIAVSPKWRLIKNHTSGTTGTPLTVYEDWPSIWREQAYFYCYRKRCGYTYGQPIVSLRGNLGKRDLYLKVHISNTLYLSSYNINSKTILLYYNKIKKHKPKAIEGYPSSLYNLALLLRDNNLSLKIPLTFTSSETLLEYQRELIEKQLNTQIYDHYGTTERTIRLSETIDHVGYYEDPGYSINEYIEDGEITTSLINKSFPLIRYRGNDIIEFDNTIPRRIKSIQGRNEDYIICKDGTKVIRLCFIMKGAHNIKASQLIQKLPGQLTIKIVPEQSFYKKDEEEIISSLEERIGKNNLDIIFEITSVDGLIYSSRGKFKYIINLSVNQQK